MTATSHTTPLTVGILHMGDLGSALATLLTRSGHRVVTYCGDRSPHTQQRAAKSGIERLDSFEALVREADLVISLVLPSAALAVAQAYAERAHLRTKPSTYLDANSIDLQTLDEVAKTFTRHDIHLVDAAIHGGAARLAQLGVLYLSGPRAAEWGAALASAITTNVLGDRLGQATSMKLLLGGMSKSLNALFLEMAALAQQADMTDSFLASCRHFYPGLMSAIERMLPTYPQHAQRRVSELESVHELAQQQQVASDMVAAASQLMQRVAAVEWNYSALTGTAADLPEIIRQSTIVQRTAAASSGPTIAHNHSTTDTMNRSIAP